MIAKTSREARETFGLERDDIKRLENDGVLHPQKNGKGKASLYGIDDMYRLLDVKMYLLGGFKISQMQNLFGKDFDRDSMIEDQLRVYSRRIKLLNFIKTLRSDIKFLENSIKTENDAISVIEAGKKTVLLNNTLPLGEEQYWDMIWSYIQLIFIFDFLSQKENYKYNRESIQNKVRIAYDIFIKILDFFDEKINENELQDLINEIKNTQPTEEEIKQLVREWVTEYHQNSEEIINSIEEKLISSITSNLNNELGEHLKAFMIHLYSFTLDYFIDEESLYYITISLISYFKELTSTIIKPKKRKGVK